MPSCASPSAEILDRQDLWNADSIRFKTQNILKAVWKNTYTVLMWQGLTVLLLFDTFLSVELIQKEVRDQCIQFFFLHTIGCAGLC